MSRNKREGKYVGYFYDGHYRGDRFKKTRSLGWCYVTKAVADEYEEKVKPYL